MKYWQKNRKIQDVDVPGHQLFLGLFPERDEIGWQ